MATHDPLEVDELRVVIADMWRMHMDERAWLDRIYEFAKGLRGIPEVPEDSEREIKDLARLSVMNILGGIRDTWTRNLSVVGYRRENAEENDPAWAMWQRNRMDARQKEVYKPATTYGAAYVKALNDEKGRPVFHPRSPRQLLATYRDPSLDMWPQYALETWVDNTDAKPRRKGMLLDDEWVYPFDLGEVAALIDDNVSQPIIVREFDEPYEHNATFDGEPVCPVVRFVNDRDADDAIVGEIAPYIRDQKAINNVNFDRLIVSRFGAQPQTVISGWSASRSEVLKASAARVWAFDDPDVTAQRLPAAPLNGYSDLLDAMIAHVYEKAGLSPAKNGKMVNLSADALALANKDENEKLIDKKESFGESWEQLLRLGAEMDGDSVTAADSGAEVVWRDTTARSLAAVVDAIAKLEGAGVPVAPLLPMLPGLTQQQIRGIQKAIADAAESDEEPAEADALPEYVDEVEQIPLPV